MIAGRRNAKQWPFRCAVLSWTVLAALVASCAAAQTAGKISGTIKDSDGVSISNAEVVLSSQDTGTEQARATADAGGRYTLSGIPYGSYSFHVEMQGYRNSEPKMVILTSPVRTVDVVLIRLGSAGLGNAGNPPQKEAPVFRPAGARGNIAPSGYSTGLSSEETAQVNQKLSELGTELMSALASPANTASCDQEPALLRAVREDPRALRPNRDLGMFYLAHGDFGKSVEYLEAARSASPGDEANSRYLAVALMAAGRDGDAVVLLEPLAARQTPDPMVLRLLAMAYEATGDSDKARLTYRQAGTVDPDPENQFVCGMGLIRVGATEEARELSFQATKAHPESARLWMLLGIAQSLLQQNVPAVQSFLRAIEKDPGYPPPYSFLAELADSDPEAAPEVRRWMAEFVVAHPENADGHFNYALALWKQSRRDPKANPEQEIIAQLNAALGNNPRLARAHMVLGEIRSGCADFANAEREFRAALDSAPENAQAHYRLSQIYRREGKTQMADEELEKFRSLHGAGGDGVSSLSDLHGLSSRKIQTSIPGMKCPPSGK